MKADHWCLQCRIVAISVNTSWTTQRRMTQCNVDRARVIPRRSILHWPYYRESGASSPHSTGDDDMHINSRSNCSQISQKHCNSLAADCDFTYFGSSFQRWWKRFRSRDFPLWTYCMCCEPNLQVHIAETGFCFVWKWNRDTHLYAKVSNQLAYCWVCLSTARFHRSVERFY